MLPSKIKYDTDKIENGLIDEYISFFDSLKDKEITLLEIGILKGGSLKFWSDYFTNPKSMIIGIDINLPNIVFPANVITYKCNQNNSIKLRKIAESHSPFNIVIDDGSHQARETKNCFKVLWDYMNSGGYYVIEDWSVGYFPKKQYKQYKGMINLIPNIIKNIPKLKIKSINIIMAPRKALAFFEKE